MKNHIRFEELEAKNLKEIRDFLETFLDENNVNKDIKFSLKLGLDEVCQNVIRHTYKKEPLPLEVTLNLNDGILKISIRDFAKHKTTLEDFQPRDLDDIKVGGLGITFIKNSVDEIYFSDDMEVGNCLNLVKKIL